MDSALHTDSICLSYHILVGFLPCCVNPLEKREEKRLSIIIVQKLYKLLYYYIMKKIQKQNNTHTGQL